MLAELRENGRVLHENVEVQYFIEEIGFVLILSTPQCVVSGMWVYLGLHVV
jgi:hypothetical protein